MIVHLFFILLAASIKNTVQGKVKCTRDFRKIGCFVRDLKLTPHLLITDLDPEHANFTTRIDLGDYTGSLHSLACRCREKAGGHYKYFGIGMYGECSAGKGNAALEALFKNPDTSKLSCVNGEQENCNVDDDTECAGTVENDFFYEIVDGDCSSKKANGDVINLFNNQVKIEKSKLITSLPKLGMVYEISLEVYPTSFQAGWSSILHMTVAGNHGVYGERIPGIWFWPSTASAKTNRLHICNALSGNVNNCVNSKELPLNKWIKIKVNQAKYSKYIYTVYVNDEKIYDVTNTRPASFDNVKVYAGDPWYAHQPGYVRKLVIAENCYDEPSHQHAATPSLSHVSETVLKKNALIGTISELCKEYTVSFDVKPTAFAAGWHSVLHLTLGGNYILYGDRAPGVWFNPSSPSAATNALHVCSPISRNRNYCKNSQQFPKNQWISVKISQSMVGADYYYRIHINGNQIFEVKNTQPSDFYDLSVYAGDPWYPVQAGSIRNININGECYSKIPVENMEIVLTNKTRIEKNRLVTTVSKVGKVYEIGLEVFPTSFQAGWASILHMTVAGDNGVYGERVPGIWFRPSSSSAKTNRLHICNNINAITNCYDSGDLPPKQWIRIKISQALVGSKYIYTIHINNEQVYKVANTRPAAFGTVKLYAGDPWYEPQAGYIRNVLVPLTFFNKPTTKGKLSHPAETVLKKGSEIGTLSKLCKVYTVSFDVKPTVFAAGWHSIFHLTLGGNYVLYGDRNPGVWFNPSSASAASNMLHVCAPISRNRNYCYNTQQLPKNQWISVKISQVKSRGDYYYGIDINGERVHIVKNTLPLDYYDLKTYAADPWYPAQAGSIRNINIDGGIC